MGKFLILSNHSFMLWQFRREIIQTLLNHGLEVVIGVPFGDHVDDFIQLGCKMIDTPLERRGLNPFRDWKLYRQYRSILTDEAPDMAITYSIKPNVYGGYACRALNIPYCVNVQGLGSAFQRPSIAFIAGLMYRIAVKNAKVVFFENNGNAAYFRKKRITPASQQLVLSGAGINLQHYTLQPFPKNPVVRFLYLGRMMKEKGIDELFTAVRRLRDEGLQFQLDLVGFFEDAYKDAVDELIESGIAVFYGFQSDARPYYAQADCVVLPSYHEGMSNVLLEAAATGRPVIASFIPGCRETISLGRSGLNCRVQDADSLYRSMKFFLELDWDERKEMGLEGRKRMEERFAKDSVVEQTLTAVFR